MLSKTVIDIINKSFLDKENPIINFITAPGDDARIKGLIEDTTNEMSRNISSAVPVRVGDLDNLHYTTEKREYNVFLTDDLQTFQQKLNRVFNDELFYFQGFFLVVMVQKYENQYKDMENIFRDMWQHLIINVNILISISDVELEMFTFYPFTSVYCGQVFPFRIHKFINSSYFGSSEKFFDDKLKNLFECPLKVVTFNIAPLMFVSHREDGMIGLSGIEGELLKGEINVWPV